jgi:hypothetical protein
MLETQTKNLFKGSWMTGGACEKNAQNVAQHIFGQK